MWRHHSQIQENLLCHCLSVPPMLKRVQEVYKMSGFEWTECECCGNKLEDCTCEDDSEKSSEEHPDDQTESFDTIFNSDRD